MEEVRVESWTELLEALYAGSWDARIERHRSPFAYRGLGESRDDLRTSLMRLGGDYVALETPLHRNFRKYAQRSAAPGDSLWNWLSLAQHHGVPTRLLDWSYSPLVATHFATANRDKFELDGAVWCVNYGEAHRCLPEQLRAILGEERSDVFTVEMLERGPGTLASFEGLSEDPFVVFFEPPSFDDRIVNQWALFAVMSSATASLDEWLVSHDVTCRRVVIPAGFKWEVRDRLDQAGVNERVLFPGLDGLARWLARYYAPRS